MNRRVQIYPTVEVKNPKTGTKTWVKRADVLHPDGTRVEGEWRKHEIFGQNQTEGEILVDNETNEVVEAQEPTLYGSLEEVEKAVKGARNREVILALVKEHFSDTQLSSEDSRAALEQAAISVLSTTVEEADDEETGE